MPNRPLTQTDTPRDEAGIFEDPAKSENQWKNQPNESKDITGTTRFKGAHLITEPVIVSESSVETPAPISEPPISNSGSKLNTSSPEPETHSSQSTIDMRGKMSSTPSTTNDAHLPAILALHGGGSNATIMKIQCRRLVWNLSSEFRFVFAQGPADGPPGTGILPVFENCAPFHRWVSRKFTSAKVEDVPLDEVRALDETLFRVMEENGGVDSFVGVLGFSQGARLVAGLLMRQALQNQKTANESKWKFKFGVVIGGPWPPISLHDEPKVENYEVLRQIPTVVAWGRDDKMVGGIKDMNEQCDGDECFQMDYDGGHHLPLKDVQARDLCDLIRAAWYAGGGKAEDET